jgi:tRNA modification GTPase
MTPRPDPADSASKRVDTIAAIATPPGRGGVGIVRVSGNNLAAVARALCGKEPAPRRASNADFRAADGSVIDSGLVLYFKAPASYTGEDVLELHGHGGTVVQRLVLERCLELGARLAQAGEFTRRAYLNGKIDLAQAEAVIDLIEAQTAAAARSAVRSLRGEFSAAINSLLEALTELRLLVEANLDFPEEDVDFLPRPAAEGKLARIAERLAQVFDSAQQGQLLHDGLQVVIAGQPNVGKSTLLNALSGDELAIVTPLAGTTRDAVHSTVHIEGVPLHIIDTAGLRETEDAIEKIGIERTWREIERADVLLLLVDARSGLGQAEREIVARIPERLARITVCNKADLAGLRPERHEGADGVAITLAAKTGEGIGLLRSELLRVAGWHPAEGVFIARERHLEALRRTREHLAAARSQIGRAELFAEELRLAQLALSAITGEFSSDDLLGEIFGRFCIGK